MQLVFDAPTNRAGMNGLAGCATVLDNATDAQVRGLGVQSPTLCDWDDDVTLIVFLSEATGAAPGKCIQPSAIPALSPPQLSSSYFACSSPLLRSPPGTLIIIIILSLLVLY